MLLQLLKVNILTSTTIVLLTLIIQNGFSKPQDASMFDYVASQTLMVAGNVVEIVGNGGIISKQIHLDLPFGTANSETLVAAGAVMKNNDKDADSLEEKRRKRSIDSQIIEHSIAGAESSLALPFYHRRLQRSKRSPCHHGGGGGGGTGGNGGGTGTPTDGDDLDITERRRRAYARRRKIAARKKTSTTNKKNTVNRKRKLLNDDEDIDQALTRRRKRQTELDDLNENVADSGNDFSQHAEQIAKKLHQVWENFMNSMNDMAQKIKQHLSGAQNSTSSTEI